MFYVFLRGQRFPETPVAVLNYAQAMWLQWVMLGIVIAAVLLGSVVFAAPSSNSTSRLSS